MPFKLIKKNTLWKIENLDKSSEGKIDKEIEPLCNTINKKEELVTTSSCSGRISIVRNESTKTKSAWEFKSHYQINLEEIKHLELPKEDTALKMEPFIIHISTDKIDNANKIFKNKSGQKTHIFGHV